MSVQLAKNENIIKSYNYSHQTAKSGIAKTGFDNNLIITDKRIISETVSEKTIIRKEIPVESADYIGCAYAANNTSLIAGILLAVLGLIIIIVGAIIQPILIIFGVIGLIAGIALVILAIFKRGAGVSLIISGKMNEHNLMDFGASSLTSQKKIKSVKIKVDKDTAQTMINEIGALLIGIKEGTYKQ